MKRIVIIGSSGSGKSTFANNLGKKLNRSVTHLDKEYYTSDWKEKYSKEEWKNFQKNLVGQNEWIIDGNYRSSLVIRLDRADTIIFFDIPKWLCLWRAFRRSFNRQQPFDKPEGIKEKISWQLIKFVINYPTKEIYGIIDGYRNKSRVFIIKNNSDIKNLLENLKIS